MSIKKVILVGAGGNLGKVVLEEMLKSKFEISVCSRNDSETKFPDSVKVFKSDYSFESLTEIFKQQDAVVSMISNTALDGQKNVLEAAVAAKVKRVLPSEYGNDTTSEKANAALPFFEPKVKALEYLRANEDKISWTSVITGLFFDWGLPLGFLGFDFQSKSATIIDGGNNKFTGTNLVQIANSIVAVLEKPEITANKHVYVESFTTTQSEVLAAVEKATGTQFAKTNMSSEDLRKVGFEKLQAGDIMTGGAMVIQAGLFGSDALEDHSIVPGGLWNERLGLPKEDLQGTIDRVVASLSG